MNSLFSIFSKHTLQLENCPLASNLTQFLQDTQSFLLLLSHIEQINWSHIRLTSSSENSLLTLQHTYVDLGDRTHDLFIDIPARWPHERPRCRTNLPIDFSVETWCPKTSRLIEIIQNFHSTIDSLQAFWTQLFDLERDAIVLDEKPIPYSSTNRRLKINDQIHVQIQIDPYNPTAFPSITFHGPPMLVRTYDQRLEQNRSYWNEGHSNLIVNLEHILDLTFPNRVFFQTKSDHDQQSQQQECGICYESTIEKENEKILYCETENCLKQYHEKCWRNWLRKKLPQRNAWEVLDLVIDENLQTTTANGPCLFCKKNLIIN